MRVPEDDVGVGALCEDADAVSEASGPCRCSGWVSEVDICEQKGGNLRGYGGESKMRRETWGTCVSSLRLGSEVG